MLHNKSVFPAPTFWKYIPYFSKLKGCLFINNIYLRKDIYENILSENPNPQNYAILLHELKHLERMKTLGFFKFWLYYYFSRQFRFNEELIAYQEQILFLKSKNLSFDIIPIAKALSSWPYFWCTNFENAKNELENITNSTTHQPNNSSTTI